MLVIEWIDIISLRFKGLGAQKIHPDTIDRSSNNPKVYLVASTHYTNKVYEVNTEDWTCSYTVGRTGYASGEPCKHQHAVAHKYNLTAPNLIPFFNAEGRYTHALIAVGSDKVGDKSFYCGMSELTEAKQESCANKINTVTMECNVDVNNMEEENNLTLAVDILQEHETLIQEVIELGNKFLVDVKERAKEIEIQYLNGLKKFFYSVSKYCGFY